MQTREGGLKRRTPEGPSPRPRRPVWNVKRHVLQVRKRAQVLVKCAQLRRSVRFAVAELRPRRIALEADFETCERVMGTLREGEGADDVDLPVAEVEHAQLEADL